MIDSIINFIQRNPLTTIIVVMLLVFAPSTFGIVLGVIAVGLLCLHAIPIFLLWRLRRAGKRMEEQAQQQQGDYGYTRQSYSQQYDSSQGSARGSGSEGDVKVYTTDRQPQKRVSDSVGDYVDFEEVKEVKEKK